ncbi:hypothetical protein AB0D08_33865 [Kitasatospora sp. NPDC048540]|uniref:hypothetical protein n=1 Tax=unclassified Kitasatospora TaxID=2633591 RepID=UPI00068C00D5|nr:hypothetical protein [Kitasatospora sp. MBT63]
MSEETNGGTAGSRAAGRRRRPLRRMLTGLLALLVVAGLVVYLNRDKLIAPPEGCKIDTAAGSGTLDLTQASNAATIAAVALSRGLPERAVTIALATAMQESKIHNLEGGDRDSLGLFQQRPSQGWGTAEQIKDPVYATNKFLDSLVKVPGYARLPLTDAAQQVQKSGYPQAYAKHETNATLVSAALTGREPAALTCVVHELSAPSPAAPDTAASPAAAGTPAPAGSAAPAGPQQPVTLGDRVRREFGKAVVVASAPKAAKDPREVFALTPQPTATADPGPGAQRQAGWAVAQWAVAQAQDLGIGSVRFDGKVWKVDRPTDGWKPQTDAAGTDRVLITLGAPVKK